LNLVRVDHYIVILLQLISIILIDTKAEEVD